MRVLMMRSLVVCGFVYACMLSITAVVAASAVPRGIIIESPSKEVLVNVCSDTNGGLKYAVRFCGKTLMGDAPLGVTVNGVALGQDAELAGKPEFSEFSGTIACRGVSSSVKPRYRQAVLEFRNAACATNFFVDFRVYDDGVAFRYRVPGDESHVITGEATGFQLPEQAIVWATDHSEGDYIQAPVEKHPGGVLPLGFMTADGSAYGAITEGMLVDYVGMQLCSDSNGLMNACFKAQPKWKIDGPVKSPWRVIMLARDLNGLVNNTILPSLASAPGHSGFDWVRPARLGWSWIACRGDAGVNLDNMKLYARLCSALGFEGNVVDEGWSHWGTEAEKGGEKAWGMIKELVEYSKALNVETWLWKSCPSRRGVPGIFDPAAREKFFRRCAELGVVGVKLDFVGAETVDNNNFMRDTLEAAARHKLMVIFHGCNKPTGLEYTWPNEVTREGIRGLEFQRPYGLNLQHPVGRLLAGHADYTPFLMNNRVGCTLAQNLATIITYTSSILMPCEHLRKIFDLPEVEFFKSVPTVWDETRVLSPSEFGQLVAFARRRSGSWFLGVCNGGDARVMDIPLAFLGPGRWLAELHSDCRKNRQATVCETRIITARDSLKADMLGGGGYAARFSKLSLSRYGGFIGDGKVIVSTADPDAKVCYTIDGGEPSEKTQMCRDGVIRLVEPCRLRVKIVSGDGAGSELSVNFNRDIAL